MAQGLGALNLGLRARVFGVQGVGFCPVFRVFYAGQTRSGVILAIFRPSLPPVQPRFRFPTRCTD